MTIGKTKHAVFAYFVVLAVWLLAASPLLAQRVCCQGDIWLKWDHGVRESYVWGYTEGYTKGTMDGCKQSQCSQAQVDFSKGSDYLVRSITEFYTRYPKDRDIYIDEILDLLGKGLTLEEIHNHPFWRHKPPQEKP